MNVNAFLQKDYESETSFWPKKTNPIQTQFTKGQNELRVYPKIRPKFLVVGAYAMGAYSQTISVYNLITFHS